MSGREQIETLFSFELLVESIRVEKESQVSDELALGVRLLDFPTLLIYQPEKINAGGNQHAHNGKDHQGGYAFNRGKSCFFKMNLNALFTHLSNTPLYAMVLDVKEEIPKCVGTSLVSLAKAMDRIRQDVSERGVSTPSSHDSSEEGDEDADYADDFNSLEPSDAYSPDPLSSPEPTRAKTPCSPLHHSDSEWVQKRAVLPVPIKVPRSPQHALRGTHTIIQARSQASALSFSSDDSDLDGSSSLQTICSRRQRTVSSRVGKRSDAESLISSRGKRSGSSKNSGPVGGSSAGSVSSFEQQEVEELEDELGSLDFRKEYKHMSELVANKLPGYTM
ncbi:hypothetical protein CgunFtcFv8_016302 [Champsocephalus gunnari]|uniref:Microtubule-associated protein 10 C-terminal domain-containing protein n=1 Tax=Champsocephalus gunnari TaxID=52237 RepID=A0AAN8HAA6_CHAGU|nr:hypothetical protein CgunFtcFv8_016302 [Champsocephalus gunnari]